MQFTDIFGIIRWNGIKSMSDLLVKKNAKIYACHVGTLHATSLHDTSRFVIISFKIWCYGGGVLMDRSHNRFLLFCYCWNILRILSGPKSQPSWSCGRLKKWIIFTFVVLFYYYFTIVNCWHFFCLW